MDGRICPRYLCEGKVEIDILGEIHTGFVISVSLIGVSIVLNSKIDDGEYILDLLIENKLFKNIKTKVNLSSARDNKWFYRIEFRELNIFDKTKLSHLVKSLEIKQKVRSVSEDIGKDFSEKRKYIRFDVKGQVTIKDGNGRIYNGLLKNISFVGLGILVSEKIEIEKIYNLDFTIEKKMFKKIKCKPKWWIIQDNKFLFGIEFVKLGIFNRYKLINILKELSKEKTNPKDIL